MTQNNEREAFEKWLKENYPDYPPPLSEVWQAATKASEQRITELQELLNDRQSDLDFEFNRAEQNELECNALKEDNNQLREELETTLTSLQEMKEKYEI